MPFAVPLQHMRPGKLLQIAGDVPAHSGRFVVNVQSGGGGDAHHVPLHLSARFDDPYDGHVLVVTNRQHGSWGAEQREKGAPHFPFQRGHAFEILILVEHGEYKVLAI